MANFATINTTLSQTVILKNSATNTDSYQHIITSAADTTVLDSYFTIASGTADTTLDIGHLTGVDAIYIKFSEAVDGVYLSTIVGGHVVAEDCVYLVITGMSNITAIHIDATNSSAAVDVSYILISNE